MESDKCCKSVLDKLLRWSFGFKEIMEEILILQIIESGQKIEGVFLQYLKTVIQYNKDSAHVIDEQLQFQHTSLLFQ